MCIVFLHKHPVTQITMILVLSIALLIWTLAIRPFASVFHLIFEIISQIILTIALAALLAAAVNARSGCFQCGGREGFLCYLILICLFAYLTLLALGLLVFGLLGRCCGSSAYGEEKNLFEQNQQMSMELPHQKESSQLNQDQFRVNTLFDQKEGFESQTGYNENLTMNRFNQNQSNHHMVNNHLVSQTHDIKNTQINEDISRIEENNEMSDFSIENITISPPRHPNPLQTHGYTTEFSESKRSNQLNFNQRFAQNEQNESFQGNLDRPTNTVRVDNDDDVYKQQEIIRDLSASQMTYSGSDIEEYDRIKRTININKNNFMNQQNNYRDPSIYQNEIDNRISRMSRINRESNYKSNQEKSPDNWGYSNKNWDENLREDYRYK